MARSISEASRTLIGLTSMPSDGAMDWMAANWLGPEVRAGSRMTPAASRGAISFIGAVEPRARLLGHADPSAYVAQQYGQYDQARSPRDHDPE